MVWPASLVSNRFRQLSPDFEITIFGDETHVELQPHSAVLGTGRRKMPTISFSTASTGTSRMGLISVWAFALSASIRQAKTVTGDDGSVTQIRQASAGNR